MKKRTRQSHRGLVLEIETAVDISENPEWVTASVPSVSGWSVHEHLEHLLRVDRSILRWLHTVRDGTATSDGSGWTIPGTVVLWLGRIPRGRGQAPERTRPQAAPLGEVVAGLRATQKDAADLEGTLEILDASPTTMRHPLLGCYTASQWLRFAYIHHVHHRRIIEDIRDAR